MRRWQFGFNETSIIYVHVAGTMACVSQWSIPCNSRRVFFLPVQLSLITLGLHHQVPCQLVIVHILWSPTSIKNRLIVFLYLLSKMCSCCHYMFQFLSSHHVAKNDCHSLMFVISCPHASLKTFRLPILTVQVIFNILQ